MRWPWPPTWHRPACTGWGRVGCVPNRQEGTIDTITLSGLTARGHHGVLPEERRDGQPFVVDVELELPLDSASDDLGRTVNYAEVADAVVEEIGGPPCNLIETLAGRIADRCLQFPAVHHVRVIVHKPQAPVPHEFRDISVAIRRSRNVERPD